MPVSHDAVSVKPMVSSKTARIGPVSVSLLVHVAFIMVIGGAVVIEQVIPKSTFKPAVLGENFDSVGPAEEEPQEEALAEPGGEISEMAETPLAVSNAMELASDVVAADAVTSSFVLPAAPAIGKIGTASGSGGGSGGGSGAGAAGGTAKGKGKISFFGIGGEVSSLVFVIDISGSMVTIPRSRETFQAVEREVEQSLKKLSADNTFNIILFAKDSESFKPQPLAATPENVGQAVEWLKRNSPATRLKNGQSQATGADHRMWLNTKFQGTRTDIALKDAFAMKPDTIIVLSDGEPTLENQKHLKLKNGSEVKTNDDILKLVKELQEESSETSISTIAYRSQESKSFMQRLAKLGKGVYKGVD